jgi:Family of unknown function (DUF5706)
VSEPDADVGAAAPDPGPTGTGRSAPDGEVSFDQVRARSSVDTMLRNTQQQLVALSGQADLKASLLTTAAAVVASIAASQIGDRDLGWAAGTLLVFLVAALLASVLAVFPKFQIHREPEGELPPHFNPLFFGHYARIPKERYLSEMVRVISDDANLYRTIITDLYDQGVYLVTAKYRYLRLSYTLFLIAFASAGVALAVSAAVR